MKITTKNKKAWVTFTYQPTDKITSVTLSGSWNEWDKDSMKEKKNGDFYITKVLPTQSNYEFKYLVDSKEWINEESLSAVQNPFGTHNTLLEL